MPEVLIRLTGGESRAEVPRGATLAEALRRAGIPWEAPCGGRGQCGKCRVQAAGRLSAPTGEERRTLGETLAHGLRLACCARVEGQVEIRLGQALSGERIRVDEAAQAGPDPLYMHYGAAVDLGTTTVAARLYGPGGPLGSAACANPQRAFGADVLTRVGKALEGEADALAAAAREAVSGLLRELAGRAGIPAGELDGVVLTGNTAMLHFLTGTDPAPLAAAPFAVRERFGRVFPMEALGLPGKPGAPVYLPPCFSAFVGADIACAALACGLCETDGAMLADVGTNGEIALWRGGRLLCCSAAAGPAFEGAGLSQGMPGADGAVFRVRAEGGALRAEALGGGAARGVCGSGVVDALAALRALGRMDETGLLEGGAAELCPGVSLTQKDIRMAQLAKAAVCAGIRTLLRVAGAAPGEVRRLAVAGGFGSALDLHSAARCGLIPPELEACAQAVGNAALRGAELLLGSRALWAQAERLAHMAEAVELSANPIFMEEYVEAMEFPG